MGRGLSCFKKYHLLCLKGFTTEQPAGDSTCLSFTIAQPTPGAELSKCASTEEKSVIADNGFRYECMCLL